HERGMGTCHVLDALSIDRSRREASEIHRMSCLESFADLTGGLKTPDSGALAGARVNDHHRTLAVIYLNACRWDHTNEGVVDRTQQGVAPHHQLGIIEQNRGHSACQHLFARVAALAQDVEEQKLTSARNRGRIRSMQWVVPGWRIWRRELRP